MTNFVNASTLLSLSRADLMRSHYNKKLNERFLIVRIEVTGLHYDINNKPIKEVFFIKIAAKDDIVKGFIECSNYRACFNIYKKISFNMYSIELYKYMSQIYNIMLDRLKDNNLLYTEGYLYHGKSIRDFSTGHINEELAIE